MISIETKKIPVSVQRIADRVPPAGKADPGGQITRVFERVVRAVGGHPERGEPNPLGPRRAVDVPIEPGVIHQDLQPAPGQEHQEQEVEIVRGADPEREAMRPARRRGVGDAQRRRQPEEEVVGPGEEGWTERQDREGEQLAASDPEAEATVGGEPEVLRVVRHGRVTREDRPAAGD